MCEIEKYGELFQHEVMYFIYVFFKCEIIEAEHYSRW